MSSTSSQQGGKRRGFFITIEGIEGSGKSTQSRILRERLSREGYSVVETREPGGTKIGEAIRHLLLDAKTQGLDPRAELFLYCASRAQHLSEIILPALGQGKIVLCDRFTDATRAYQGFGRALPLKEVEACIRFGSADVTPDLTLLLDLDVRIGLARLNSRHRRDRMDQEGLEFHEQVRRGYLMIAKRNPGRIKIIDASPDIQSVAEEIGRVITLFLTERKAG